MVTAARRQALAKQRLLKLWQPELDRILNTWNAVLNPPARKLKIADMNWTSNDLGLILYLVATSYEDDSVGDQVELINNRESEHPDWLNRTIIDSLGLEIKTGSKGEIISIGDYMIPPDFKNMFPRGEDWDDHPNKKDKAGFVNDLSEYLEDEKEDKLDNVILLNPPATAFEVTKLVDDVTRSITARMEEAGVTIRPAAIEDFVVNNLFTDWEIDPSGRAVKTERGLPEGVSVVEQSMYRELQLYSLNLLTSPDILTFDDIFWESISKAVELGYYPKALQSILLTVRGGEDPSDMDVALFLEAINVDPGENPIATADRVITNFFTEFREILGTPSVNQDVRSGNPSDKLSAIIEGNGLVIGENNEQKLIFPLVGAKERGDQENFVEFTSDNWIFTDTIEENIARLLAKPDNDFGETTKFALHPGTTPIPEVFLNRDGIVAADVKKQYGVAMRELTSRILETPEGIAYSNAQKQVGLNPSLEQAYAVWLAIQEELGPNNYNQISRVQELINSVVDNEFSEKTGSRKGRKGIAEEYLDDLPSIAGLPEDIADEISKNYDKAQYADLVHELSRKTREYSTLNAMREDEQLLQWVVQRYGNIKQEGPWTKDMTTIEGRETELDALLQDKLTSEQYGAYQKAPDAVKNRLLDELAKTDLYPNRQAVLQSPVFSQILQGAVTEGEGVIAQAEFEQEQTERAQEQTERANVQSGIGQRLMGELRQRGIITEYSSPEFIDNLNETFIMPIMRRAQNIGGIDNYNELGPMIEDQIRRTPIYNMRETEFNRQLGATPEDVLSGASLPPGVHPSLVEGRKQWSPPEYPFDVSTLKPALQDMVFDRPEFASFLNEYIQTNQFREEFQEAARQHQAASMEYASGASGMAREKAEDRVFRAKKNIEVQKGLYDTGFGSARETGEPGGETNVDKAYKELNTAERELEDVMVRFAKDFPGRTVTPAKRYTDLSNWSRDEEGLQIETYLRNRYGRNWELEFAPPRPGMQQDIESRRLYTQADPYRIASQETDVSGRRSRLGLGGGPGAPISGLTEAEFFRRKLPGFETRYKASPFFRMEEQRLEKEQQIEDARLEQERLKADAERRKSLTAGTRRGAGTGLTVFRTRT